MKISEFKRWLERRGVKVKNGRKHWKLHYQGKQSVLNRHPSHELPEGTRQGILRQLGLTE